MEKKKINKELEELKSRLDELKKEPSKKNENEALLKKISEKEREALTKDWKAQGAKIKAREEANKKLFENIEKTEAEAEYKSGIAEEMNVSNLEKQLEPETQEEEEVEISETGALGSEMPTGTLQAAALPAEELPRNLESIGASAGIGTEPPKQKENIYSAPYAVNEPDYSPGSREEFFSRRAEAETRRPEELRGVQQPRLNMADFDQRRRMNITPEEQMGEEYDIIEMESREEEGKLPFEKRREYHPARKIVKQKY